MRLEIFSCLYIHFSKYARSEAGDMDSKDMAFGFVCSDNEFSCLDNCLKPEEITFCIFYLVNNENIAFTEFRPNTFMRVRKSLGLSNQKIANSLYLQLELSFNSAKFLHNESNNSLVLFTSDNNFVIKTISNKERQVFFQFLLEPYCKRILNHPESKLVRILGVFQILTSNIHFILMENTSTSQDDKLVYDLKGSSVDRYVKATSESVLENLVLKDENFRQEGQKIRMDYAQAQEIAEVLKADMKILRDIGIMDYSVLLTYTYNPSKLNRYFITPNYSVAIIDLFQLYNVKKALERWFKIWIRRVNRSKISVVSPNEYYNRLSNFIKDLFSNTEPVELSSIIEQTLP
jgi:hypothetical protein